MQTNQKIAVLIVDPHKIVRSGLRSILEKCLDIVVVGESGDAKDAIDFLKLSPVDVVILEPRLPNMAGHLICRSIKECASKPRVLVFSTISDEQTLSDLVLAGIDGYLAKEANDVDIPNAVRQVFAGTTILDPLFSHLLMREVRLSARSSPNARVASLTQTEHRLINFIVKGCTNKEIAAETNLAEKTVRNYLSVAFEKLNVRKRSEAAVMITRYETRAN